MIVDDSLEVAINAVAEAEPASYTNILNAMAQSDDDAIVEVKAVAAYVVTQMGKCDVDIDAVTTLKNAVSAMARTGNKEGYLPIATDTNISEFI